MASWVVGDRIKETTTTTGTGNITLAGAVTGFEAFSGRAANGDLVRYAIVHQSAAEWEIGLGTWVTGNILQRTTVLQSSNADALVNFSAGTKDVFCAHDSGLGQLPVINTLPKGSDQIVPENGSVYVSSAYEIAAATTLELRAGAVLEIG